MNIPKNTGAMVPVDGGRYFQANYGENGWSVRILSRVPNPVTASVNKTILRAQEGTLSVIPDNDEEALRSYLQQHELAEFTDVCISQLLSCVREAGSRFRKSKEA